MTIEEMEWSEVGRWGACPKRTAVWLLLLFASSALEALVAFVAIRYIRGI